LAAPSFDQLPDPLALMSAEEVVQHHDLLMPQARGKHLLNIGLEDRGGCGAFHRKAQRPIPSRLMLAKSVVFAPRLRGTFA
jgi:hypothetical protein